MQDTTKAATSVPDLIGEFGIYQLSLTIVAFVRYVCVAMMTNSGALIAPTVDFWCRPPDDVTVAYPINVTNEAEFLKNKCDLEIVANGFTGPYKCQEWSFDTTKHGLTLTDAFKLNCDRDWYRSAFQSSISIGVTLASVVFGSFSDENGRRLTLRISCVVSLVAGSISVLAPDYTTYTVARSICSMSDIGIVSSLYTLIVETLGNKYRGSTCIIVFTGWSMGVMVMPWITEHFLNFRHVMLFTVCCHILTLPWLMTVGESIRWLLINENYQEAKLEVERICSWNMGSSYSRADSEARMLDVRGNFEELKARFEARAERRHKMGDAISRKNESLGQTIVRSLFGGFLKVGQIFKSKELLVTTITIVWTTFNSELMYMLFILINSDVGDNIKLNYAIGGLMEILATLIAIVMISRLKRRLSLSSTLLVISASIFTLAFTHNHPAWSIPVLNFTKLAISTLSSLIYVIATELFPTSLRQTGMGLAATLGSMGAVVAPFIRKEVTDMIGMSNVMLLLFCLPFSAAVVIPLCLRETKDVELPDDVDELEQEAETHQMGRELDDLKVKA